MRYHVLHIKTAFPEEWRKAVFDQMLCTIGVDTIDGDDYYLPSEIWEQKEKLIPWTHLYVQAGIIIVIWMQKMIKLRLIKT